MRKMLRWLIRKILEFSPAFLKNLAVRVPFSRFSKIASWLFWGEEVIRWRGVLVKVNPGHIHEFYPYFLGDYAKDEIEKLIGLCKGSSLFVDVGANIGLMSLAIAFACPKLEVFAFEPDHNLAKKFHFNLGLNQSLSDKVHLIEKAVADVNGDLFFQPSLEARNIESGRLTPEESLSSTGYPVACVRLDTFFDDLGRYPEVIKIDVEGAELFVLRGLQGLFDKGFPKAIIIEVHAPYFNQHSPEFKTETKATLEQAGFSLCQLEGKDGKKLELLNDWPARLHILATRN